MTHVRGLIVGQLLSVRPIASLLLVFSSIILDTLSDRCLYHVNVFAQNDVHLSETREVLDRLGLGYVVLFII